MHCFIVNCFTCVYALNKSEMTSIKTYIYINTSYVDTIKIRAMNLSTFRLQISEHLIVLGFQQVACQLDGYSYDFMNVSRAITNTIVDNYVMYDPINVF